MLSKSLTRNCYTRAAYKSISFNTADQLMDSSVIVGSSSALSDKPTTEVKGRTWTNPHKIVPIVDFKAQTIEVCKIERIRRSTVVGSEPLWKYMFHDAQTLVECFKRGARLSNNGPCLGYRKPMPDGSIPYVWMTYGEVLNRSENLARGLLAKGIRAGQSSLIGVYSQNRPELVIAEQACYFFSSVVVPLYDTLGPDACSFIVKQAELEAVICDEERRAEILLHMSRSCSHLRLVIMMQEPSDRLKQLAYESNVELIAMNDVEALGEAARSQMPPSDPKYPSSEDVATVCYTSGTSGNPKGALLTHGNVVAASTSAHMLRFTRIRCGDVMLSFLPMAHVYERLLQTIFFTTGGCVGFSRGNVKLLPDDIRTLRPHVIPSVPRLLNRVYDKLMLEVGESVLKKWLLKLAVKSKMAALEKLSFRKDTLWDEFVFKKLQESLGGRVKLVLSGSAPISREVLYLLRSGMGALVVEGYGTTETAAAGTATVEGDISPDHVGIPTPSCEVKLIDVVEMNYFAKHGRGEVCIRGNNVFKGYFKDEANTAKALDKYGWLHTGDIGIWTPRGTLLLTERKKNIFKLDQGEYIAPEKIENVYNRTQYVYQTYVHGDSMRPYLVGVVVPDPEILPRAVERRLGLKAPFKELCRNERVAKMVHDDMILEGHKAGLQSFEQVKKIVLDHNQFTVENGLLTPTLKSKRNSLKEYYKHEIFDMYNDFPKALWSYGR